MAASTRVALVSVQHCRNDYSNATDVVTLLQVTGANQGIGLEIVRQLCRKFDGRVLLAGAAV